MPTTTTTPTCANRVIPPPERSRELVAAWCAFADLPTRTAFTQAEALELLSAIGYRVDAAVLAEFTARGYFTPPPSGKWTATAVHQFSAALESRRRWKPTPNKLHDPKKSRARLEAETSPETIQAEAKKFSVEDMLLMLVDADHREIREALLVVIQARLQLLGFTDE